MVYNKEQWKKYYEKRKKILSTPEGKKSQTISRWKTKFNLKGDLDKIYDLYLKTDKCNKCNSIFTTKNKKCLDHNHETNEFRFILCNRCNSSMPDKSILRNNKLGYKNMMIREHKAKDGTVSKAYVFQKHFKDFRYQKQSKNFYELCWHKFVGNLFFD